VHSDTLLIQLTGKMRDIGDLVVFIFCGTFVSEMDQGWSPMCIGWEHNSHHNIRRILSSTKQFRQSTDQLTHKTAVCLFSCYSNGEIQYIISSKVPISHL